MQNQDKNAFDSNGDENQRPVKPFSKYRDKEDDYSNKFNFKLKLNPRRVLQYVLVGFIFLVTLYLFVLIFDSFIMPSFIHDKPVVEVPNLVGKSLDEASGELKKINLHLEIFNEQYSEEYPEETVIKQIPDPGSQVKEGRIVHLTLSKGMEKVPVPYLIGKPVRTARVELMKRGLKLGELEYSFSDEVAKDTIMKQQVSAGNYVPYGYEIDVTVSKGSEKNITIPNLVGLQLEQVELVLSQKNLTLGVIERMENETFTAGTVFKQEPQSGEFAEAGQPVNIFVSK